MTTFNTAEKVPVTLTLEYGAGNDLGAPAGPVVWSSPQDGPVVTLAIAADTLSCDVLGVGVGTADVTATDQASGLSAVVNVEIVAVPVVPAALVATVGEPVPQ